MKKCTSIITALFCFIHFCSGQDVHYSQFNASPLTLNPAITGKMECTYRAALAYRTQWAAISPNYNTYSAAFDAALFQNRLGGDVIGAGFLFHNDVAGDGNLSHMNLAISLAYHKVLADNYFLSAGIQGAYIQRGLDMTKLIFPDQIGPDGVRHDVIHDQGIIPDFNYLDLHTGLHFSGILSEEFSFNVGAAYFHVLQPVESFMNDREIRLSPRFTGHGGVSASLSDQVAISPSVLYQYRNQIHNFTAGTSLKYALDKSNLYLGGWHRFNDAFIFLLGVEFEHMMFGISYDATTSSISKSAGVANAFELSFTYNGCILTERSIAHCPVF